MKKRYEDSKFIIFWTNDNYIVVRKHGKYEQHSHFKKFDGAKLLVDLYYKKIMPLNPYFKKAMERICTQNELKQFTKE